MDPEECVLSADENGHILDRLVALEQLITEEDRLQALRDAHCPPRRRCVLNNQIILAVVLAMGIFTTLPIRRVFKACRRLRGDERTPGRSALCLARQRLGVAPLRCLYQRVVRPLAQPHTPGAFYHHLRLMSLDGTVLDVPDSDANAAAFGRPLNGKGEGAFPQIRKLSLVEVGTHVEVAFVVKGVGRSLSGERSMAPALFRHLQPDMLLVWDRGFFSYSLCKEAIARGAQLLIRGNANLILQPIRTLSDGTYLAKLYRGGTDRNNDRDGIMVRVIRYTLNDPQRVGHGEVHVLLTTLLDEMAYPAEELIVLYHERWEIELVFDEQKTHQDPRRASKPAHLRSETPAGVMQEVYALSLGHYVTRTMMVQAAERINADPDRLSFTGCFQILQLRMAECPSGPARAVREWWQGLLEELSQERIEPRRNRVNPRVVKRQVSKFAKKRREHRGRPPLQYRFIETVVMLR